MTFEVVPIETPTLGDRSYLAHDGRLAVVVDPQRDIDRIIALAGSHGVEIAHVVETHIHNDYVTGGRALAAATGAAYHVNGEDPVRFAREPVVAGSAIEVSPSLGLRVVATPGHTFTHLSYVLSSQGRVVGVFTGGSLLFGSTGRPDLLGPARTPVLVRAQHASVRRLAAELPDDAAIFPTHGFGSFCSATQTDGTASTIGHERKVNPALTQDERSYVEELLAGLDAFPAYYAWMAPANLAAPDGSPDLSPPRLADADELRRRIEAGEWVVDVRERRAFAAGHLPGTVNLGMDGQFATYLGWLVPPGTPLTLLGRTPGDVAEAQRELVRIGIDRPSRAAVGTPADWTGGAPPATTRLATFEDLQAARSERDPVVLDVRRRLEWAQAHLAGAVHLPLHELQDRLADVPVGEVWVHCRSGYRAAVAASLLAASGRGVVCVDDEFANAEKAGVEIVHAGS
ncbi:MAG TPA: MBL fold metallo-hydrolase [Kineosporiaceae bacterium]|nr:MBL fold metallo-hydrolase [Kineosporiaceae bacterium]